MADLLGTYELIYLIYESYDEYLEIINQDVFLSNLSDENKKIYFYILKPAKKISKTRISKSDNIYDLCITDSMFSDLLTFCFWSLNDDLPGIYDKSRKVLNLLCNIFKIDIDKQDNIGRTASMYILYNSARIKKYNKIIRAFLDHGIDIDKRDMSVKDYDYFFNEDFDNKNNTGKNLLDYAIDTKNRKVISLIQNYSNMLVKDPGYD